MLEQINVDKVEDFHSKKLKTIYLLRMPIKARTKHRVKDQRDRGENKLLRLVK